MELFDQFLQERTYLKGVSPDTLRYYKWVRRAFLPILQQPTKAGMLRIVQHKMILKRALIPIQDDPENERLR